MKVLNLSSVRITGYELVFDLSQLPDIVVTDGTTPKNYIHFISHHFPTVHIGEIEIPYSGLHRKKRG
jgi:hypothetical protein